jgi:hypothetical protein
MAVHFQDMPRMMILMNQEFSAYLAGDATVRIQE